MITPEQEKQIDEFLNSQGLGQKKPSVYDEIDRRIMELDDKEFASASERSKATKIAQGVGNVTGGTKIAQGLGQTAAMSANTKDISHIQKLQGDQTDKLIKALQQARREGKDTSNLVALAYQQMRDTATVGRNAEKILNPNNLTGKQIAGDALQLASTAAGGKAADSIARNASKGFVRGAAKGIAGGVASGAVIGAAEGAAQGLKKDGDAKEIGMSALKGAGAGAAIGGVLGGTTGAIAGTLKKRKDSIQNFSEELITPELNKKATETAIKTGKVVEGVKGAKRDFTEAIPNFQRIKESVDRVPGISRKKTFLQNSNAIHDEIGVVAEDLKNQIKNKGFFSPNEFKSYMFKVKSELAENPLIVGDAEKTADKIIDKFNKLVGENGYTPEGLLESRKQLDRWMLSQKGSKVFSPDKENAISIALRAIRQGGNNFLSDRVEDVAIREMLEHQSNLYQAIENIAPKAAKEGESWFKRFLKTPTGKVSAMVGAAAATGIGAGIGVDVVRAATNE